MCARYTQTKLQHELEAHFDAEVQEVFPRFNIAPTQECLVIQTESPRTITGMRWGITRDWAPRSVGQPQLLINARGESIVEKKTFVNTFQSNRCLVVADSFYEWRADGKTRQPIRFLLKSEEPFAFAGVWNASASGKAFAIITTEANDLIRPVHNRMPVIVERDRYSEWLSPDTPFERLAGLLKPLPPQLMKSYEVNPAVSSAREDSPECIEPFQPKQGSLF